MEELLTDFIAETREMLADVAGELVAWEASPDDRSRLDGVFRFFHTVKGSCFFLDLGRLGALAHAAEDVLAAVRDGRRRCDPALVDAVLAIVDRIATLTERLERDGRLPVGCDTALIAALDRFAAADAGPTAFPEEEEGLALPRTPPRSMRLSVDLLDRMMIGVSEVELARGALADALSDAGLGETCPSPARSAFERLSRAIAEMNEAVVHSRMAPIDGLFSGLPRMVRDLGLTLGREVRFDADGGNVELGREMIEMIRDPLTHIVRNAVDHGIEPPEERIAAGKPAAGRLTITARQRGQRVVIEARDDGRGIDADGLAAKAVAAGIVTPGEAEAMSRARKLDLMFMPGITTARAVTAISGRGVGMDVVRANVERIGGTIEIDSDVARGTTFRLHMPLTLATPAGGTAVSQAA